jgi:hypothetical protein
MVQAAVQAHFLFFTEHGQDVCFHGGFHGIILFTDFARQEYKTISL